MEKLDEILSYLKMTDQRNPGHKRIEVLEGRLDEVTDDIREVKQLLRELVAGSAVPRHVAPETPPRGSAGGAGAASPSPDGPRRHRGSRTVGFDM